MKKRAAMLTGIVLVLVFSGNLRAADLFTRTLSPMRMDADQFRARGPETSPTG